MMIYSLAIGECIHVSEAQYEYHQCLAEARGHFARAFTLMKYRCTMELKQQWVKDRLFWPACIALSRQIARASVLNESFVKDHLVAGAEGKLNPSQLQAINIAARMLAPRNVQQGRVEVKPDQITVEFSDGPMPIEHAKTQPMPISGPNTPLLQQEDK